MDWAGKTCGFGLFINFKMCASHSFCAILCNSFWQPQKFYHHLLPIPKWGDGHQTPGRLNHSMRIHPCWLGLQWPHQHTERTALFLLINSCCQPPSTKSFQALVRGLILWMCQLSSLCTAQGRPLPNPSTFPSLTLSTGELGFTPRWWDRQRV